MFKYITLQSGSTANCTIIYDYKSAIILDCGVSTNIVKNTLREIKMLDKVDLIIVSHEHVDHNRHLDKYIEMLHSNPKVIRSDTDDISHPKWKLEKYELKHSVDNYGYTIKVGDSNIFWATDTMVFPEIDNTIDWDLFLVECSYDESQVENMQEQEGLFFHCEVNTLIAWLVNYKYKNIQLLHLSSRIPDLQLMVDKIKQKENKTILWEHPHKQNKDIVSIGDVNYAMEALNKLC